VLTLKVGAFFINKWVLTVQVRFLQFYKLVLVARIGVLGRLVSAISKWVLAVQVGACISTSWCL
jgi:hypothetical protein